MSHVCIDSLDRSKCASDIFLCNFWILLQGMGGFLLFVRLIVCRWCWNPFLENWLAKFLSAISDAYKLFDSLLQWHVTWNLVLGIIGTLCDENKTTFWNYTFVDYDSMYKVYIVSNKWIYYKFCKMTLVLNFSFWPLLLVCLTRNDLEIICECGEHVSKIDMSSFKILGHFYFSLCRLENWLKWEEACVGDSIIILLKHVLVKLLILPM